MMMRFLRDRFRYSRVELWMGLALIGMGISTLQFSSVVFDFVADMAGGWFPASMGVMFLLSGVMLLVGWVLKLSTAGWYAMWTAVAVVHIAATSWWLIDRGASWLPIPVYLSWYAMQLEIIRMKKVIEALLAAHEGDVGRMARLMAENEALRRSG